MKKLSQFVLIVAMISVISYHPARASNLPEETCLQVTDGMVCAEVVLRFIPNTATGTPTEVSTDTPTDTPTSTQTETPTETQTETPTQTLTNTPTNTPTPTEIVGTGTQTIGLYDSSANEFHGTLDQQNYTFGETTDNIRKWIGHSTCSSCLPGTTKTQSFTFENMVAGMNYQMTIIPYYVSSSSEYYAEIYGGQISKGNNRLWNAGYKDRYSPWQIVFTAESQSVTISIGNNLNFGTNYMYIDVVYFYDTSEFQEHIISIDGDWYRNNLWSVAGSYQWTEGYVMDKYLDMYDLTGDDHWISRYILHADSVLSQRNNGYVWNELSTNYPWVGFSGAMTFSMARFASEFPDHPKSYDYAYASVNAIRFHDQDWVSDHWIFGNDNPYSELRGRQAAYNMQCLAATTSLFLSDSTILSQAERSEFLQKSTSFASYFKSKITGTSVYLWKYSDYYSRLEDVGHGNFCVFFAYQANKRGIVFTDADMNAFSQTFLGVLKSDSTIPYSSIDGFTDFSGVTRRLFYWQVVSSRNQQLSARLEFYDNQDMIEEISTRYSFLEQ